MKKNSFFNQFILSFTIVLFSINIYAQKAKEFYTTAGWMYLAPQSSSSALSLVQSGNNQMNVELPNTAVRLGKSNTLGLTTGYFFTDHWAVEFTVGIPPKFDIKGWDALASLGKIAETTAWTPILQVKYKQPVTPKFNISASIGATYCWFTSSKIVNPQLSQLLGGATTLDIGGAFSPVFSGGLNYNFNDNWFIGGNFSIIPLKVTGNLNTQNQTTSQNDLYKIDVTLNPMMTYIALGYVFHKHKKII